MGVWDGPDQVFGRHMTGVSAGAGVLAGARLFVVFEWFTAPVWCVVGQSGSAPVDGVTLGVSEQPSQWHTGQPPDLVGKM